MAEFTNAQVKYLKSQRLGDWARSGRTEPSRTVPLVSPSTRSGTFEVGGFNMGGSQKYKNAVANGQVAFVVDDLKTTDPWKPRMVEVRGTAEALPQDDPQKSTIRIHPQRIISFGLDEWRKCRWLLVIRSRSTLLN